jgi:hypothetical protein
MEQKRDSNIKNLLLPSPAGKRNYDLITSDSVEHNERFMPSPASTRLDNDLEEGKSINFDDCHRRGSRLERSKAQLFPLPTSEKAATLTDEQKSFIRQWHHTFAVNKQDASPADESIHALATLVLSPTQSIRDFLHTEYPPLLSAVIASPLSSSTRPSSTQSHSPSHRTYTLREANHHLRSDVLALVEKYVTSCRRRRRPQKDGRRSVNEGPFKCTYGCGYRTKRAFDWKRHEETHEPQELWLCHLCHQPNEPNPFLVNRKDKFLRHVKDAHQRWEPETVLEMSKVDFRADFGERCGWCEEVSGTWDERCRHVLAHFEEGGKRDEGRARGRERGEGKKRKKSEHGSADGQARHFSNDSASDQSCVGVGAAADERAPEHGATTEGG